MCRCVYLLVLLFSIFGRGLSSSPAMTHTVRPGENVTLFCSIPPSFEMVWYRQINDELTMIMSATIGNLHMDLATNDNKDSKHFIPFIQNKSLSLTIVDVRQSDIGLYYCGIRENNGFNFTRAVKLHFADTVKYTPGSEQCWTPLISVCCTSALMLTLCLGVIYRRGLPSCCCVKDDDTKEADLNYASLRHNISPRERRAPPTIHNNVLYDTVGKKPTKSP